VSELIDDSRTSAESALPDMSVRSGGHMESMRKTSVWLARDLANYISDSGLAEGTKLPNELSMAQTFQVGRTTVREALRILEMRGVITIRVGRGGGPVVRTPKTTDLAEALGLILQFRDATLADVIDARRMFEPVAARLACGKATAADIEEMHVTVKKMLADPGNDASFSLENARFHSLISDSVQNPAISTLIDSLKFVHDGRPFGIRYSPPHVKAVAKAHLAIVAAIESGDADAAEEAMRAHLDEAKRYWSRRFTDVYNRPLRWINGD
jgi:DNA-binding FadR family transcriptional regulator